VIVCSIQPSESTGECQSRKKEKAIARKRSDV
jgi:hypothetical protein